MSMSTQQDTKSVNVADIDLSQIKESIKEYLRSQSTFEDYNFEGSAMSTLLNVLAYVTHINAINANIGLNETFLDTAKFRGSVVGRAKALGYIPASPKAAMGMVDVTIDNPPENGPTTYTMERGRRFNTSVDGSTYSFVTTKDYISENDVFSDVQLFEGVYKTTEYVYDVKSSEKMIIPDRDVDTSTLRVSVYTNDAPDASFTVYNKAKDLTSINSQSSVYFLSENPDGVYEIQFGDGVLGKALQGGMVVRMEYVVTHKEEGNGAKNFMVVGTIPNTNSSSLTVTTKSIASGGSEREDTESVRKNAPITFATQNRAVIPQDYDAIIRENFSNIESIKVWGGEDNSPPIYGKVFISIKPKDATVLSPSEKEHILRDILYPKSVVTVTPEFADPEILYITPQLFFKYDPTLTNLSLREIENKVRDAVRQYDDEVLGRFDRIFRYSNFLRWIDQTDPAILNSFARIYVKKAFVPVINLRRTYELDFSTELYRSNASQPVIVSSTTFTVLGQDGCQFKDVVPTSTGNGDRQIDIVRGVGQNEVTILRNVGYITSNKIVLNSFMPSAFMGNRIEIEVIPNSYDIVGSKVNILTLNCECSTFKVQGEVDSVVSGRDFSGINYNTTSKDA